MHCESIGIKSPSTGRLIFHVTFFNTLSGPSGALIHFKEGNSVLIVYPTYWKGVYSEQKEFAPRW